MAKKLFRSKKDSIIAGVCGGIAEYFDIDSTLVRLLVILVVFLGGIGVIAYIIAWIIIPPNPEQEIEEHDSEFEQDKTDNQRYVWGGLILIFFGLFFLLRSFLPRFVLIRYWPLILVIVGVILLFQSLTKKNE